MGFLPPTLILSAFYSTASPVFPSFTRTFIKDQVSAKFSAGAGDTRPRLSERCVQVQLGSQTTQWTFTIQHDKLSAGGSTGDRRVGLRCPFLLALEVYLKLATMVPFKPPTLK